MLIILEEDIDWFIEKFMYVINYKNNNINTVEDLRKYIYINNFKEEEYKKIKDIFKKYGEKKVLECIMKLKDKNNNLDNKNKIKNCMNKV